MLFLSEGDAYGISATTATATKHPLSFVDALFPRQEFPGCRNWDVGASRCIGMSAPRHTNKDYGSDRNCEVRLDGKTMSKCMLCFWSDWYVLCTQTAGVPPSINEAEMASAGAAQTGRTTAYARRSQDGDQVYMYCDFHPIYVRTVVALP